MQIYKYIFKISPYDGKAMKRVLVTFTPEQWERINAVKPLVGLGDADTVRTIVINWLIDKGYLTRPENENGH